MSRVVAVVLPRVHLYKEMATAAGRTAFNFPSIYVFDSATLIWVLAIQSQAASEYSVFVTSTEVTTVSWLYTEGA